MLQQARSYFREDGTLGGSTPITLLRADVARLPFATGSQAAIHAGKCAWLANEPQADKYDFLEHKCLAQFMQIIEQLLHPFTVNLLHTYY